MLLSTSEIIQYGEGRGVLFQVFHPSKGLADTQGFIHGDGKQSDGTQPGERKAGEGTERGERGGVQVVP